MSTIAGSPPHPTGLKASMGGQTNSQMNSARLLSKDEGNEKHTNSEEALLNKNFLVGKHQF